MADSMEKRLLEEDLTRMGDWIKILTEEANSGQPVSGHELWERRLIVQATRKQVKEILQSKQTENTADWQKILNEINRLMLENFTRQMDSSMFVIPQDGVKYESFVSTNGNKERRSYLGLHLGNYDNDGLSVVVAVKPTLHEQPYHAHEKTHENSLAIHPTTGLSFPEFGKNAQIINADPGVIICFKPFTPHTLKNPTHFQSADASVKIPDALGDRVSFERTTIVNYLMQNNDKLRGGEIITPLIKDENEGFSHIRYLISDCGKSYLIDYLIIKGGKTLRNFDIGKIKEGTIALMTVFPQQNNADATFLIGNTINQTKKIEFNEWLALDHETPDGLEIQNLNETSGIVYFAREIN